MQYKYIETFYWVPSSFGFIDHLVICFNILQGEEILSQASSVANTTVAEGEEEEEEEAGGGEESEEDESDVVRGLLNWFKWYCTLKHVYSDHAYKDSMDLVWHLIKIFQHAK